MSSRLRIAPVVLFFTAFAHNAHAAVTVFTNKAAWQSAAGPHTTIDFVGYPQGLNIHDLYADVGVTFTDGQDWIWFAPAPTGFNNDNWGFDGGLNDASTIVFDQTMGSIAVDFPGRVQLTLFNQGQIIYESPLFSPGGYGNFRGLISDQPFDSVIISDHTGVLAVDDLHFGPPIPAPAAGAVLVAAAIAGANVSRRRKASP